MLAAESANIVTVDVLRAVMSTEEGKIKVEKLKGEFEKEKAGLEALNMKGKNLQERIQKDGAVMSAEERHKMEKELMLPLLSCMLFHVGPAHVPRSLLLLLVLILN